MTIDQELTGLESALNEIGLTVLALNPRVIEVDGRSILAVDIRCYPSDITWSGGSD